MSTGLLDKVEAKQAILSRVISTLTVGGLFTLAFFLVSPTKTYAAYGIQSLTDGGVTSLVSGCTGTTGSNATTILGSYVVADATPATCNKNLSVGGATYGVACTSGHSGGVGLGGLTPASCKITAADKSTMNVSENTFSGGTYASFDPTGKTLNFSDNGNNATATGTTADYGGAATKAANSQCNLGPTGDLAACMGGLIAKIIKWIALAFLYVAAAFAALAGLLLNWVIYVTVFQFGNIIGNNPGMLAAWGVLRDIGNIILLFGFIFMGVSTILNLPGSEYTAKRALPALIIFAILLNFSLFAAEGIIDTSNALGTTFYRQASNGMCASGEGFIDCITKNGIGGKVLTLTGISAMFDAKEGHIKQIANDDSAALITILGLTIFAAVTAFVFLAAVLMLVTRAVVLAFLMAISPIGFAGMAIPPLHRFAKMWWDAILKQSFFAPIYILLVLISLKFMDGVTTALSGGAAVNLAQAFDKSGASNVSMVIVFMLITGFMLAAVQIAQSLGAVGASGATRFAGAAVFGGMARVTNLGAGSAAFAARTAIQRTPLNRIPGSRFVTNTLLRPLENANLDVRRLPGMGRVNAVAGGPAEHASLNDMKHQVHEVQVKMDATNAQYAREMNQARLKNESLANAARKATGQQPNALSTESQRFLAGLSVEELAAMHDIQHGVAELVDNLSTDQFEGLMKTDKLSQTQKNHVADARFAGIKSAMAKGFDEGKDDIRKLNNKELEMLAKYDAQTFDTLLKVTDEKTGDSIISNDQNEHLGKSSSLTKNQRDIVYAKSRKGQIENAVSEYKKGLDAGTPEGQEAAEKADARIQRFVAGMNSKNKAKLANSALIHESVIRSYSVADLTELQREGKLNDEEIKKVAKAVRDSSHPKSEEFEKWFKSNGTADGYWHKS